MRKVNSDDVVSILEFFKDLEDPRSTINRRHLFGFIRLKRTYIVAGRAEPA